MRKSIVLSLVIAFGLAVFASPAAALQHDPNNWQVVDIANPVSAPSGDDTGWDDPALSPPPVDVWYFLRYSIYSPTLYWLFDITPDVVRGDDGGTNTNDQIVPSGGSL